MTTTSVDARFVFTTPTQIHQSPCGRGAWFPHDRYRWWNRVSTRYVHKGSGVMFAKVFGQIFDSSLAEDYNCRRMFMDLLVLADSDGVVDMTSEAIARRTNAPLEEVRRYIGQLSEPDPLSRCPDHEGRRLILIDSHRNWGWRIVNYLHYRNLKDEESRREYFRDAQRARRQRLRRVKDVSKTTFDRIEQSCTSASASSSLDKEKKEEVQGGDFVPTPLDVYRAYPLKVGRPRAIQEIQRAIAKFGAVFVLERTVLFANTRNGDKSFMPHPSTWFHQERFNDDPSTWRRNGSEERRSMSAFEIKKRQEAITEEINRIFKRNGSKRVEGDGIEELKKHRTDLQHQLTV